LNPKDPVEYFISMKRSTVNQIILESIDFFAAMNFVLPPFAFYEIPDWKRAKENAREIFDVKLGWDITDFGKGDFRQEGLTLFTLRNGLLQSSKYPKPHAEKIMISDDHQVTPMHFHWRKMEDIIVRSGRLVLELYLADDKEALSMDLVTVSIDGIRRTFMPGEKVILGPGESICLPQRMYHRFYSENGESLIGEVSQVNDDFSDNRFLEPAGRFPDIEEDESPRYLLCGDYAKFI
jgi:hypothetical protein